MSLTAEQLREVDEFYWETDISTFEIAAAFGLAKYGVSQFVQPFQLVFNASVVLCLKCKGPVLVYSRADRQARLDRIADWTARGWAGRDWAHPFVCKPCSEKLQCEEQEIHRIDSACRDARLKHLRIMPYREYLQTPEWAQKRAEALKRARHRCQTCAGVDRLQVHHRTYARRGAELAADLIALCDDCHGTFHKGRELAENGRADRGGFHGAH